MFLKSADACGFVWMTVWVCLQCLFTWSLKVWFSAWAAASSLSLSLSFSCVLSQVLRKLFTSSLMSTLFWQFSRTDFCKANLFQQSNSFCNCMQLTWGRSSQFQFFWFVTWRPMLADIRELFIWSKLSMAAVRTFTSDSRLLRCELAACRNTHDTLHF